MKLFGFRNPLKLLLGLAAVVLATILIVVLGCELITRRYYAECVGGFIGPGGTEGLSCSELGEKYGTFGKNPPSLLFEVKAKRETGVRVPKADYRWLAEELVLEVDRADIEGNNGRACGYWGYVSRDLPGPAKLFVRRHELTHILGVHSEFQANKEAGLEYPFGFVQTGVITVWRILTAGDRPFVCRVAWFWTTFKKYCLPGSWEPPDVIF